MSDYPRMIFPYTTLTRKIIYESVTYADGLPCKENDLFFIELSEDKVLDLDWINNKYILGICDNHFDFYYYYFHTTDPIELTGEIMRILKEYGWEEPISD